ncbi:MAG: DUF885 domain-containing protein [bacterium]
MKIVGYINLFVCLGLISVCWARDFPGLSNEILEEIWSFHPITATHLGIHKYDKQMPDYSKKYQKLSLKRFKQLSEQLDNVDTTELSDDELVDYYLLRSFLYDEIFDLETRSIYEQNPLLYVQSCVSCVYTIMIRHAVSAQMRMQAVTARLKEVPAFLEVARENLTDPAAVLCDVAISQLNEGEKFIEAVFESYKDSLPESERRELQQAKMAAVAAMMRFAYWIEKNQNVDAQYFLGEESYNYKLRNIHLVDLDADTILRIGEYYLARTTEMIDSLNLLLAPAPRQIVTLPPDFGKDDVAEYREEEIEYLRDFVTGTNIVTVPGLVGSIEIVETPRFLRSLIPGMAMIPPGPFDASRTSYFFVPPVPVNFDMVEAEYYYNYISNRWFRGGAVHEAYPGHHLQLSISNHHPSVVRRNFRDNFFIEGWALYCEEIMAVSGLYEDTIGAMINALEGVRYRAARVIVDVKLQTGVFTYDDALRFMTGVFGGDESYYAREIKRYISNPIQPSSYLIGKIQLLELQEDYKLFVGDDFDPRGFHDELLSHGSIPFKLVRRLILNGLE